jgi:hypothetical protein
MPFQQTEQRNGTTILNDVSGEKKWEYSIMACIKLLSQDLYRESCSKLRTEEIVYFLILLFRSQSSLFVWSPAATPFTKLQTFIDSYSRAVCYHFLSGLQVLDSKLRSTLARNTITARGVVCFTASSAARASLLTNNLHSVKLFVTGENWYDVGVHCRIERCIIFNLYQIKSRPVETI